MRIKGYGASTELKLELKHSAMYLYREIESTARPFYAIYGTI